MNFIPASKTAARVKYPAALQHCKFDTPLLAAGSLIFAKVEVTVQDGAVINFDILEHKNGRGKPAEIVVDRMVEEQKIDVDAVSGATNSSIVIKKAVENALTGIL